MLNLDTLGLSAVVTASGIRAPDYQTILAGLTEYFQQIYGADAYLEPDSKDGQMLALYALGIHDANNMAVQVYNSFSPATGIGNGLSSNVKINGISRTTANNSTVDLLITGTIGTTITSGSVRDANNMVWRLPDSVTIGTDGSVTVTATCTTSGAVAALPGTVTQINTPTMGWVKVTNPSNATVGAEAESDTALRLRQAQSVALASVTPFDALDGAIANIAGVTRHKLYENDTGSVDANGLPAHSITAIIDGGDVNEIAGVIERKKGQGVATNGSTMVVVDDKYGNPHPIRFSRPINVPIYISMELKAFSGYTTQIGAEIRQAVADYINNLGIGQALLLSRVYSPANIGVVSGGDSKYYDIHSLQIGLSAATVTTANINLTYDQLASCDVSNIAITVT